MRKLAALFAIVLLAGCGPRYVTDYDMFPPPTAAGKQCVTECVVAKESCEKSCYQDALQCERHDRDDFYTGFGYSRHGYWNSNFGSAFPSDNFCPTGNCVQACRAQQLQCHTNCGGTIQERPPRCVHGCQGAG
jgi:hypothetical protein